jgi:type II secretory pathway component GspD/PulD (secretin)
MRLRNLSSAALLCALTAGTAYAQGDLPVTTTRVKEGGATASIEGATLSKQPRYFLDTIDNLSRSTSDETRSAPGLAKNNYIGKVYEIRNTEAIQIQTYLLRTLAYEGGIAEVMGADQVKDGDAKVQYLFVTAPDFMIPGIDEIVAKADRPGFIFYDATGKDFGGGTGAQRYVGKHRTASELKSILAGTELGNIGVFLFPPFADDSTNSIYVVDNPQDMADNIAALQMFDVPPLQVEIEATIYEISEEDRGKLGVDWDSWKRFFGGSFSYETTSGSSFFSNENDIYSTILTLDAQALADFLNYTVQSGSSRVVTSTKLTMTNSEDLPGGLSGGARGTATGEPAVIESQVAIPYTTTTTVNEGNGRGEVVDTEIAYEGVRAEILPFIGTETITLKVSASVNSLVGYSKENDIPLISSRSINSIVNLKDGEPVVLGGLEKTTTTTSRVGLPLLKDIPVVGYLFSKESKGTTTSKILIALKPRIKTTDTVEASKL